MSETQITIEEANAILAIKDGADVSGYGLAGTLRGIQRRGLPVNQFQGKEKSSHKRFDDALFTITDLQCDYDGAGQLPYFGAIATKHGIEIANQVLNS